MQEAQINAITDRSTLNRRDSYEGQRQYNDNRRQSNYRNDNHGFSNMNIWQNNRRVKAPDVDQENIQDNIRYSRTVVCYKCNQPNHIARNCMVRENSLNSWRHLYPEK